MGFPAQARKQDEEIVDSNDTTRGLVVLAVDDEQPALEEMAYLLDEDPRVATVLKAGESTEALRILNGRRAGAAAGAGAGGGADVAEQTDIDAVFLDIRMPGLDGLELARVLQNMAVQPAIVFVTAHDDRAVDAYDVGAIDYLLKPLRTERLSAALDRILSTRRSGPVETVREETGGDDEVIPVELAGTTKLVPRSAVRYVEAQGDYARLHTTAGEAYLVRVPLTTLEEQWAEAGFHRIHRSLLVALAHVTEVRTDAGRTSVMVGDDELPVSRRHTRALRDVLVRRARAGS